MIDTHNIGIYFVTRITLKCELSTLVRCAGLIKVNRNLIKQRISGALALASAGQVCCTLHCDFDRAAMAIIESILLTLAIIFLLNGLILAIECMAALLPAEAKPIGKRQARPSIAVLVPAHNEELDISTTLRTLLEQTHPQDRVVVIADNCTDNTAKVARSFKGVTVIERWNDRLRGKGYAMEFGLEFLASNPPEVVLAVDSDCSVGPGTVENLAYMASREQRPVQATYLMESEGRARNVDALSAFALIVKNKVRPRGLKRLFLPCILTGSGMAFPWSVIRQVSLASSKTVDDMQLTLDLSVIGYPPIYCPTASVTGRLMKGKAAKSQRSRWEHGHLEVLLQQVPHLLQAAWKQRRLDLLAMALDLSIPPMSLLALSWISVSGIVLLLSLAGIPSTFVVDLLGCSGLLIGAAIFTAWFGFAADSISIAELLSTPLYILWKLPIYLAFLVKPKTRWVSTERD